MDHSHRDLPAAFNPTQCVRFPEPLKLTSIGCVPNSADSDQGGVTAHPVNAETQQFAARIIAGFQTVHYLREECLNFGRGQKNTYSLRTLGASTIEKSTVSAVSCSIDAAQNGGECEACQ